MRGEYTVGLVVILVAFAGAAAANDPPMAEAGLDQDGTVNATVYLDAGGSLDPDGEVSAYEWGIERPNGTVTTPDCVDCPRTNFVPMRPGRYNVTMTVTDDAGASMADTMHVDVEFGVLPGSGGSGGGSANSWGGAGWGGGGNSDSVVFNNESGAMWIQTDGNGVQLSGADRDPQEYGASFNKWMSEEEINQLSDLNIAKQFDNKLKVEGQIAEELRNVLKADNSLEHKYKDARTFTGAEETAENVLENYRQGQTSATDPTKSDNFKSNDMEEDDEYDNQNSKETSLADAENNSSQSEINQEYLPRGCSSPVNCPYGY